MCKKKVISFLLAASLVMSLAACSGGTSTSQSTAKEEPAATEAVQEETPEAEPAADTKTETTVEAVPEETEAADTAVTGAVIAADNASTASTAAAETAVAETMIENAGFVLPVPNDYMDLLIIDTPENDDNGILFSLSEKASVEAAEAQGDEIEGAGWLFDIGVVTGEDAAAMLKEDMSGRELIAKDSEGNGYVLYHPTDVRVIRENYDSLQNPDDSWNILTQWVSHVKYRFVTANEGLTAENHTNTELDIYFQQMLPPGRTDYTLTKLEYAMNDPMGPKDELDPTPYLDLLTNGVTFKYYDGEAPDGEYVVLNFPESGDRFDFFFAEEGQNIVRKVTTIEGEEFEELYEATVDGDYTITGVMNEWCDALAAAYGYTVSERAADGASTPGETAAE